MYPVTKSMFAGALLIGGILSGGTASPQPLERPKILADECLAEPGYLLFRSRLTEAVLEGDGERFRALFHPQGSMRVWGIGGSPTTPDWGLDRPEAERMWAEMDKLLSLGCAVRGEKLMLPAMATLAEDGVADPESVIAIDDVAMRKKPDNRSKPVKRVRRGETLTDVAYPETANWVQVTSDGRRGYVPSANVRSPLSFQMVLVRYEGEWRIREFGSGV